MDEAQKSLERYEILDRIAVGGMAEVFLAKAYGAHGFEKTLAIKRILPELARDPEFEARFIAEAKVSVRLSHANVVQVMDFGRIGESLFIAMEFVDGLDLAAMQRKFKESGRLIPLPAAFHIAIEIIRALDYAHQHNVVHRDVSPSNILISRAGEVKIADFGIAVAARPHKGGGPGPKRVMGKWRYMSPEQTRGDTLDTRSDLFSAASVLYELFTGEKLFPGEESEEIIKNIAEMPIPRMAAKRSGIPSRLDEVVGSALARKPIDRPGRPAVVLRQLIELSYESSIMATAMDVADALATVIPARRQSGHAMLDDVIRKQLHEPSVARRTAVTDGKPPSTQTVERNEVSTGLFRKIDTDGLAVLEVEDHTKVAAPRARRATGNADALREDVPHDPDRRTEVGGPPTGAVPKHEDHDDDPVPVEPPTRKKKFPIVPVGIGAVLVAGVVLFVATRGGGEEKTQPVVEPAHLVDAAIVAMGTMVVDPEPEGATGTVTAPDGASQTFGPTAHGKPTRIKIASGVAMKVHIEHPRYRAFDRDITVGKDETYLVSPVLVPADATLHAVSDPAGASVTLAGANIGDTPLTREVAAGKNVALVLQKPGYQPVLKRVELVSGQTLEISEKMRVEEKFGTITIGLQKQPIWADVFFNGRLIQKTFQHGTLRLPVGRQTLRFVNAGAHIDKAIPFEVDEKVPHTYTTVITD